MLVEWVEGWSYNEGEDIVRSEEWVVMRYNSVLDLHTHTLVSGHAYCSLREMAKAAAKIRDWRFWGLRSMRLLCRGPVISIILRI